MVGWVSLDLGLYMCNERRRGESREEMKETLGFVEPEGAKHLLENLMKE